MKCNQRALIPFLLFWWLEHATFAAPLNHTIFDNDSAVSYQTQRVCHSVEERKNILACVPSHYITESNGRIGLNAMLKANEKAYHIISKFVDKNVDRQFLESLFEEDNFQDVSGRVKAEAIYSSTAISYTPIHMAGALRVSNPSLPQLTAAGFGQSVFRITQNWLFDLEFLDPWGDMFITVSPFHYSRTTIFVDTDLYSLSVLKLEDILEKKKENAIDGDLGISILPDRTMIPGISIRMNNLSSPARPDQDQDRPINLDSLIEPSSQVSLHSSFQHQFGKSLIGMNIPFAGVFEKYSSDNIAGSYTYQLTNLGAFVTFTPTMSSFGFLFHSKIYLLGIQYTDEVQNQNLTLKHQKHAYVYANFYF